MSIDFEKEFLSRLEKGEDPDAIAESLSSALNSAREAHAANLAAEAKRNAELAERREAVRDLYSMIVDYYKKYLPDQAADLADQLSDTECDIVHNLLAQTKVSIKPTHFSSSNSSLWDNAFEELIKLFN